MVIQIDQRAFFVLLGTLGMVAVFAIGLFMGASQKPGAASAQSPSGQIRSQVVGAAQPGAAQGQVQNPAFWQQPPADNTAIKRAAAAHAPDGDHPHIALPELEKTNYVLDVGTPLPGQNKTESVVTLKNTGNRDLKIEKLSGT